MLQARHSLLTINFFAFTVLGHRLLSPSRPRSHTFLLSLSFCPPHNISAVTMPASVNARKAYRADEKANHTLLSEQERARLIKVSLPCVIPRL